MKYIHNLELKYKMSGLSCFYIPSAKRIYNILLSYEIDFGKIIIPS